MFHFSSTLALPVIMQICFVQLLPFLFVAASGYLNPYGSVFEDVSCICGVGYNASITAYYPIFDSEDVSDYTDMRGKKLHTLQEFIDGRSPIVTASVDRGLNLPYGTQLCVPELNRHYRRRIVIEARDTDESLDGFGTSRVDICVRSEADSYDLAVNQPVHLIIEK